VGCSAGAHCGSDDHCVCQIGMCGGSDGTCLHSHARRLDSFAFRLAPASHPNMFVAAQLFSTDLQEAASLSLLNGWRWERDDATWFATVSPENASVLISTRESWPLDPQRRRGPIQVLDLVDESGKAGVGVPQMVSAKAAGEAEWQIEKVGNSGDGRVMLRHVRSGRLLSSENNDQESSKKAGTAKWLVSAFLQLVGREGSSLTMRSTPTSITNIAGEDVATFQLTPPSALEALENMGLVFRPAGLPEDPAVAKAALYRRNALGKGLWWCGLGALGLVLVVVCCGAGGHSNDTKDAPRHRETAADRANTSARPAYGPGSRGRPCEPRRLTLDAHAY